MLSDIVYMNENLSGAFTDQAESRYYYLKQYPLKIIVLLLSI